MLSQLRGAAFGLIGASVFALYVQPTCAQTRHKPRPDPYTIPSSAMPIYAKYYAPYAILAAVTYFDVQNLREGDFAGKAIESVFNDQAVEPVTNQDTWPNEQPPTGVEIRKAAMEQQAFGQWRYQFGSDAVERCYDYYDSGNYYHDKECDHLVPEHLRHDPGPTFQVWAKTRTSDGSCAEVGIGFRGTLLPTDWNSDFRVLAKIPFVNWKYPEVDDSYRWLSRNINAIIQQIRTRPCYRQALSEGRPPVIVSAGHSLGGGLAQLAAFANKPTNKNDPSWPRIEKVFAFEPSPETGGDLIDPKTLNANRTELEIDRVRHIGDASGWLQYAADNFYGGRGIRNYIATSLASGSDVEFYPASNNHCRDKLLVRNVELGEWKGSPVDLHVWVPIAAQFVVWSERRSPQFDPAPVKGCETLYQKRPKETAPLVSEISNPPAVFSPPQGLTELGAPRQLYAASPKQTANFVQRQALFASAANLGARQGSAAFAQTQLANVGQAQTLFGPGPTPVSGLGARRGSNPTPQTQLAVLDRRVSAPPPTKITDLRAQRAPARHVIGRNQLVHNTAVGTLANIKARGVASTGHDLSYGKSAIASAL